MRVLKKVLLLISLNALSACGAINTVNTADFTYKQENKEVQKFSTKNEASSSSRNQETVKIDLSSLSTDGDIYRINSDKDDIRLGEEITLSVNGNEKWTWQILSEGKPYSGYLLYTGKTSQVRFISEENIGEVVITARSVSDGKKISKMIKVID